MPLVETGYKSRAEHSETRPPKNPFCFPRPGQRLAPRAEQQETQQAVTKNVPAFADEEVPVFEVRVVHPE